MRLTQAFLVSSLTLSAAASADRTSWHGTANGDVAVTDNVFAAPTDGNREGDFFFQLRPGLIFTYASPRMIHDLNAEAEVIQYALHSRQPSLSGRGGWRGFYVPGPRSEVITSLNAGTGVLAAIGSLLTPDATMLNVQPVGKVTFRQADASEYFSWVATRELRLSQNLFARANRTSDNADELEPPGVNTVTTSAEAGGSLGLERSWRNDSLSLEGGASVLYLERVAPPDAAPGMGSREDRQVNPRGRVQWRHDINRRLSASLDGGVVFVVPFGVDKYNPTDVRQSGVFPIVGGTFSVTEVWGRASMSLRRDVTPNLFIAQNTINDSAAVSVAMPIPWFDDSRMRAPKWIGLGSVGVQRTQLVDSVMNDTASSIGAARVDVGVVYTVRPGMTYTARYELQYQTGDDRAVVPIQGFFRNTVYFSFNIRYPDRLAAQVPKRRAGGAVRADRKDLEPLGAEPVVPDLTDGGGDDGGDSER